MFVPTCPAKRGLTYVIDRASQQRALAASGVEMSGSGRALAHRDADQRAGDFNPAFATDQLLPFELIHADRCHLDEIGLLARLECRGHRRRDPGRDVAV